MDSLFRQLTKRNPEHLSLASSNIMAQDLARKIVMIKEGKISSEEIRAYQKKLDIDEKRLNNHNTKLPSNSTIIYNDGKLIKYSDGTMAVIGIASPFIIEDKWTKSK